MRYHITILVSLIFSLLYGQGDTPNVLLIIADDLGVDYLNGYHTGGLIATTPTLDSLRNTGVTFENVIAAPRCSPTRAAIMSGLYGVKTGVSGTPGNLPPTENSLFNRLQQNTNADYATALIGKWHLTNPATTTAPLAHGMDFFDGFLGASPESYYAWSRTTNGASIETETDYATTVITDAAIEWLSQQEDTPWLMWLAHAAPHGPFEAPPEGTYSITNLGNNRRTYVAMIENLDYNLNRLFASMSEATIENTLIIFVGDNGTPGMVLQDYPTGRGKSTLYQGGVRVPLIVSGAGVSRMGEREPALVNVADLYTTLLETTGLDLAGGTNNSLGFSHLLTDETSEPTRTYNYTDLQDGDNSGYLIRNERYKLIEFNSGTQEMYDLLLDSFELNELITIGLTPELELIKNDLELEAAQQREDWSCRDFIMNGAETGIDCGGDCAPCTSTTYTVSGALNTRLSPNPASDQIQITADSPIERISIYDSNGRLLFEKNTSGDVLSIEASLNGLPYGLLFLEVNCRQGNDLRRLIHAE